MPFGKWKDFDDCVRDLTEQGKDAESAKRICGALQARLGTESFSWVGDIQHHGKNMIRGKAIHPVKTVHPREWPSVRVYLEEELRKAAHTFEGAPLLLDHLYPIDGKVLGAEYEDGAIEYVAQLNDERVLGWIEDGAIGHCSVEYDWSNLDKVDGVVPRGIQFTGLALLKNFEPGDPETTVEVWEGILSRLKEARQMASERGEDGEKENLKKAQRERTQKYGISPKEGGHLTKPAEYESIPEDQFADPVNYRYPVDAEHVKVALTYFNQPDGREAGGYTHEESVKIMAKIIIAALNSGIEVSWQPEDPVYRNLPKELKKKLAGFDGGDQAKESVGQRNECEDLPIERLKEKCEDLRNQATIITRQKEMLEEKVRSLEREKVEFVAKLGDGIINPSAVEPKIPDGYIKREAVLDLLPARIPMYWGHGPTQLIRKLEVLCAGKGRLEGPMPYVLPAPRPPLSSKKK